MVLTYKYRLKGKRCARQLRHFSWATNQVWNFCVQTQRAVQSAYREGLSPRWPSFYNLKKLASGTSRDLGLHAQTIHEVSGSSQEVSTLPALGRSQAFPGLGTVPGAIPSGHDARGDVSGEHLPLLRSKEASPPRNCGGGCFVEDARGPFPLASGALVEKLQRFYDSRV